MNRNNLIHLLVLSQIADGYDDFDHIRACVAELAAKCGVQVASEEVRGILWSQLSRGLAKAYRLSPSRPKAEEVAHLPDAGDRCYYFLLSESGVQECKSLSGSWPFDENDELRADWVLSESG